MSYVLNQIKSNHFYCHITTAQVPWWVKFLWACSRQCKKQQFTYGQYIFTDVLLSTLLTNDNILFWLWNFPEFVLMWLHLRVCIHTYTELNYLLYIQTDHQYILFKVQKNFMSHRMTEPHTKHFPPLSSSQIWSLWEAEQRVGGMYCAGINAS